MQYTLCSCDSNLRKNTDDKSPVDEFLQNTSITIVSNVQRRRGIASKIIWLILASMSFFIAGFQSYGLINDYLQCKIKQVKEINPQNFPPFPSVTVCDANPVNWTYLRSINHSIYKEASTFGKYEIDKLRSAIILGLLRLPESERQILYDQSTPFEPEAVYANGRNLPVSNITFRDIVWGQCVTYNEALYLNPIKMIGVCSNYGVHIKVPIELEGRVPNHFGRTPFALVHPRGSPPAISFDRLTELFPYDKTIIRVEQAHVIIESDRKCLSCIKTGDSLSMENVFDDQSTRRTYGYTFSGCIMGQTQRFQLKENNCADVMAPMDKIRGQISANTTLCSGNEIINFEKCEELCEYLEVYTSTSRWSKLIDDTIRKKLHKTANISEEVNPLRDDIEWRDGKQNPSDAILTIHQTKGFVTVRKMAMYCIWDLLGIIGGHVSLWLGISMLSLWEIIELGCMLAKKILKRHFNSPKSDMTKVSPMTGKVNVTHVFKLQQCNTITMPTST